LLVAWDKKAAHSADRYLANSTVVAERIRVQYGMDAIVVPPPPGITPGASAKPIDGLEEDFFLCVSRLLPYKNLDAVIRAFAQLPNERLVIVGTGPEEQALRRSASSNITFLGRVDDEQLRWLYPSSTALVAASYEDFGLTPIEAAGFGRPAIALRWGGFLDAVAEGKTGVFFDEPIPDAIAAAVREFQQRPWQEAAIRRHADGFSERRFIERIRAEIFGSTD
jgi:glycosyltransferase involved in cell wall biosynthesis